MNKTWNSDIGRIVAAIYEYANNYEGKLGNDCYCGPAWLSMAHGACQLLSGPGDFDGGTLDRALRNAARKAGFSEEDVDEI